MKHTEADILRVLDNCCDAFTFPMLDNGYVYLAATRLSLFRDNADWAMTIEVFGFSPRAELPDASVYCFGVNSRTGGSQRPTPRRRRMNSTDRITASTISSRRSPSTKATSRTTKNWNWSVKMLRV